MSGERIDSIPGWATGKFLRSDTGEPGGLEWVSLDPVASSGDYDDLSNKPTLGSAAAADVEDFASAAQGSAADTAVQPGGLAEVATTGDYADLSNRPTLGDAAARDVGTTAGTVAAGDDSRIVGAVPASALTTDGDILTRTSGVPARITRDDLAADAAFSGRYVSSEDVRHIVPITQEDYDLLDPPDPETLYLFVEEE